MFEKYPGVSRVVEVGSDETANRYILAGWRLATVLNRQSKDRSDILYVMTWEERNYEHWYPEGTMSDDEIRKEHEKRQAAANSLMF